MTEEEAKEKACCKGRNQPISLNGFCIGSACMAWRWKTVANPDWQPSSQMAVYPQANAYSLTPQGISSETHGGCGLAGAPQ